MAIYNYKAKNKQGKLTKGTLTAATVHELEALLADQGIKLLAAKEEKSHGFFEKKNFPISEKVSLCRYLGLIIRSGMSLSEGLNLLASGTSNKTVKRIIDNVASQTRQGKSLYTSFEAYQEQFGSAFMTIIKTGETAGTLAESFEYLAHHFQQEKELRNKVLSAMLYPFIIVGLMIVISLILFMFVLPRLAEVFSKMNLNLPFFTKLLFSTSLYFNAHIPMIVGIVLVLIVILVILLKSKAGKNMFMGLMWKTPIVSRLILDYNLARFTQSLSALLKSSVPVTEAVELSVNTLSFIKTENLSKEFGKKLASGISLSQTFHESKIFPQLMVQLIMIGEKTGNLEIMLTDLSKFYEDEVENSLKNFVTALEPTLMIIVGIGVGGMVISVISPIYSLIGQMQAGM
jgi:type IV pilus assembly protein PilC